MFVITQWKDVLLQIHTLITMAEETVRPFGIAWQGQVILIFFSRKIL